MLPIASLNAREETKAQFTVLTWQSQKGVQADSHLIIWLELRRKTRIAGGVNGLHVL